MHESTFRTSKLFECTLLIVVIGMSCIAAKLGEHKLVVLNLFFLPIILDAYFRGRTSACIMALLSVLAVTIVSVIDPNGMAAHFTPLVSGFALAMWAGILGLAAILVGTLCDERAKTVEELHQAYVGVVEVLSRYLQGGHPTTKSRSIRVAELSQRIAEQMRLSQRQIDDIRVAALLFDLGNVEITTNLITKVVDTLEANSRTATKHTFAGMDLVHSLGTVLHSAVPLLLDQDRQSHEFLDTGDELEATESPLGARIISAARAFDQLTEPGTDGKAMSPTDALWELTQDRTGNYDANVLKAMGRVALRPPNKRDHQHALA